MTSKNHYNDGHRIDSDGHIVVAIISLFFVAIVVVAVIFSFFVAMVIVVVISSFFVAIVVVAVIFCIRHCPSCGHHYLWPSLWYHL